MSRHPPSNLFQSGSPELRAIDQALRAGDVAQASRLAGALAAKGNEHPTVLMLAAHDSLNRGVPQEALTYGLKARGLSPRDPDVLNAYALALTACSRPREALAVYDAALRQAPIRASLHFNKGCAFEAMNDNARARISFERALALQANYPQALARLAYLAAERRDGAEARSHGERVLRLQPGEPVASLALAMVDIAEQKYEAALARLSPLANNLPASINRALAQGLAGDAFDALGKREEAFRAYSASNGMRRLAYFRRYEAPGVISARARVERLAAIFRDAPAEAWRAKPSGPSERTHVFLVGFPRSGITLIEHILAAHPGVETMDGRECLIDAETEFLDGNLDQLAALDGEALEPWRDAYWARAAEFSIAPTKPVFVDKLPYNAVLLCLVAKLFPDARVVFVRRDPMDAVWSAFRRRFGMSSQLYELLTLEGAAHCYDAMMGLVESYRDKLGLQWHDVVYESVICDLEGEARKLCAFLGLKWDPVVLDFAARTRARTVHSAAGAQVARGLSAEGIGRWLAYSEQLAPILPLVASWRTKFGYL